MKTIIISEFNSTGWVVHVSPSLLTLSKFYLLYAILNTSQIFQIYKLKFPTSCIKTAVMVGCCWQSTRNDFSMLFSFLPLGLIITTSGLFSMQTRTRSSMTGGPQQEMLISWRSLMQWLVSTTLTIHLNTKLLKMEEH